MERLTGTFLILLAVVTTSCSHMEKNIRPDKLYDRTNESAVLGPEAFQFCGGWVELWAQVRVGHPTRVLVKASPPTGSSWTIRNAHVVVEPADVQAGPIRFSEPLEFQIHDGEGKVTSWPLVSDLIKIEESLKVAVQPFDGCPSDQSTRGVVLRQSFER